MSISPESRFINFKTRALQAEIPLTAYLELSYRCTQRCVFCYNSRHHDLQALSTEEWKRILDDLRELGTLFVCLTGGEPMLHEGFLEIARGVRERHMALRILSNGSLIDDEMADALAELKPFTVELSLHGASAGTHDATTSTPGSFLKLWAAVEALNIRNVPLLLKTPLTRLNEAEIRDICALVREHGIPHSVDSYLTPTDAGNCSPLRLEASLEGIAAWAELLEHAGGEQKVHRSPGGSNCGLGRLTLAVDPEGWIYPCIQWRHSSMGNVRQQGLAEMWPESGVRKTAAALADEVNEWLLGLGEARSSGWYCPAEVMLRLGTPFEGPR